MKYDIFLSLKKYFIIEVVIGFLKVRILNWMPWGALNVCTYLKEKKNIYVKDNLNPHDEGISFT